MLGPRTPLVKCNRGFCKLTAKCSQYSEVQHRFGFDFDFDGLGARRAWRERERGLQPMRVRVGVRTGNACERAGELTRLKSQSKWGREAHKCRRSLKPGVIALHSVQRFRIMI